MSESNTNITIVAGALVLYRGKRYSVIRSAGGSRRLRDPKVWIADEDNMEFYLVNFSELMNWNEIEASGWKVSPDVEDVLEATEN